MASNLIIPPQVPRFNVLGVGVSALTLGHAVELITGANRYNSGSYICVTGVHGVSEAQRDQAFCDTLNRAWLNVPDGMPLVWLGRRWASAPVGRVYGPDLMLGVCDKGRARSLRHFFCGGGIGVADQLAEKLVARFPGMKIVGTMTPPFRPMGPDELSALVKVIRDKRPDIVWVGLSTPKQERFMSTLVASPEMPLLIGVGAAFDFNSGRVRQAPRWIQPTGFEWLFRICVEPRRLGPRYLRNNTAFLCRLALQVTGLRKYPPPNANRET